MGTVVSEPPVGTDRCAGHEAALGEAEGGEGEDWKRVMRREEKDTANASKVKALVL